MTHGDRPRLLVTGASGFIGSAVLRAAAGRGLPVVGFCRRPVPVDGVKMYAGDITDRDAVTEAMQGVSMVVHAAGLAHQTSGVPPSAWTDINVTGTRVVVERAVAADVGRVVCISSVAVYGSHPGTITEETPCRPAGPYATSKHEAELVARETAAGTALALCLVRPATVAGVGDPGSVARLARLLHRRRFLALGDGRARKCVIGVDDVAEACVRLATAAPPDDGTYNLAGPPVCLDDIVRVLSAALDVPPPRLRAPQRLVEWTEAALVRLGLFVPRVGSVAHGLRAWLTDQVYATGRYEARHGRLVRADWRRVLQDEARWIAALPSGASGNR